MGTIKKHYEIESAKEKPNQALLTYLSKVSARKTLTLEEWRLTGRFVPKEDFIADNPSEKLLATCKEIIEYAGKSYVQVLNSGTFRYTSSIKSKVLDEVENQMWPEIAEKLWCESC